MNGVTIMVTKVYNSGDSWRMSARITFWIDGTSSTAYNYDGDAKNLKPIAESFCVPVEVTVWRDMPRPLIPRGTNITVRYNN